MFKLNRREAIIGGMAVASATAFPAIAQSGFPNRPIRYLVGYAPGGTSDLLARPIAQKMSEILGQPVVVENRPGAAGSIATTEVAAAEPDGYTILHTSISFLTVNPHTMDISYDPLKDIEAVGLICRNANILAVHPSLPVNTLDELVAYAKEHPGELNYATPGVGTAMHVTMEYFKHYYGIDIVHVPYKGSAPAVTDLLAGQVQVMMENLLEPYVKDGSLRGLAITGAEQLPGLPDLPSLEDGSRENWNPPEWYQFMSAPRGLPADVRDRLNAALNEALVTDELIKTMQSANVVPGLTTPQEIDDKVRSSYENMDKFLKESGIKLT